MTCAIVRSLQYSRYQRLACNQMNAHALCSYRCSYAHFLTSYHIISYHITTTIAKAPYHTWSHHNGPVTCFDIHDSGAFMLTAGEDRTLRLYSLLEHPYPLRRVLTGHRAPITWASFGNLMLPDKIFSTDAQGHLALWS